MSGPTSEAGPPRDDRTGGVPEPSSRDPKPGFARRIMACALRLLQGCRWYRYVGRALCRGLTVSACEEPDPASGSHQVRLQALWRGRMVAETWVLQQPQGLPPAMGWWVFSLHVEPAFRGLGIGAMLVKAALREAQARGGHEVYALVRATNWPSLGAFRKSGFLVEPASPVAAQWMADNHVAEPHLLLRRGL